MDILVRISTLIDKGEFVEAKQLCAQLHAELDKTDEWADAHYKILFNLAGFYIDIGHLSNARDLSVLGCEIMEENAERFVKVVAPESYFYNLANAKTNLVSVENTLDLSFENIEELVEVKNYLWRAEKETRKAGGRRPEILVNLANTLKRQCRISEALRYYDIVNSENRDIPQSHVNRSDALKLLNVVSETYSFKMLDEIAKGYQAASESKVIPASWSDHYHKIAAQHRLRLSQEGLAVGPDEREATQEEYDALSNYRKFELNHHLTLSEHGLYCSCVGSARDNLTIPLGTKSIAGDFVPKMELVLNRIKSEFSLARRNYFEYLFPSSEEGDLLHEDCFTELYNGEVLGISVEKAKVAFRLCFGILDKIGVAVCNLYGIKTKGAIYFHNFWRLDEDGRRDQFEAIRNPGLLALYSIATDLNVHKNGEWSCFKEWRNALEHGILIITDEGREDPYKTLSSADGVIEVRSDEFRYFIGDLLQLTRSSIFSFVFAVRHLGLQNAEGPGILCELSPKNYFDDL